MSGNVNFNIKAHVANGYIYLEFTDFFFMNARNQLGYFDDKALLSADGVHFLTAKQMPWDKIKQQYYGWARIMFGHLKQEMVTYYQSLKKKQ